MSPRLKVILGVIIGAVAVLSQLAVDAASIERLDTGSAFVRLGIVFAAPAFAAAVAGIAAHRRADIASAWANAFLGVMAVVGGSMVVADILVAIA